MWPHLTLKRSQVNPGFREDWYRFDFAPAATPTLGAVSADSSGNWE
jgi:hypothetical protein